MSSHLGPKTGREVAICAQSWPERSRAGAMSPAQLALKGWYPYGWLDQSKPASTTPRGKTVKLDASKPPPNHEDQKK